MKRIAIKLIIFLLLGAVVNVGVAWGLAATVRTKLRSDWEGVGWSVCDAESPHRGWVTEHLVGAGSSTVISQTYSKDFLGTPFPPVFARAEVVIPDWAKTIHHPPFDFGLSDSDTKRRVHDARGWPMFALWCAYDSSPSALPQWQIANVTNAIRIDRANLVTNREVAHQRLLPLRPIFPGFLINTLFYAAILWLLWSAPFVTRRLIRKRRGKCVRCGYDLRHAEHDVCPECGSFMKNGKSD